MSEQGRACTRPFAAVCLYLRLSRDGRLASATQCDSLQSVSQSRETTHSCGTVSFLAPVALWMKMQLAFCCVCVFLCHTGLAKQTCCSDSWCRSFCWLLAELCLHLSAKLHQRHVFCLGLVRSFLKNCDSFLEMPWIESFGLKSEMGTVIHEE